MLAVNSTVTVSPAVVNAPDVVVHVDKAEIPPPQVTVHVPEPKKRKRRTKVIRDAQGEVTGTETTEE